MLLYFTLLFSFFILFALCKVKKMRSRVVDDVFDKFWAEITENLTCYKNKKRVWHSWFCYHTVAEDADLPYRTADTEDAARSTEDAALSKRMPSGWKELKQKKEKKTALADNKEETVTPRLYYTFNMENSSLNESFRILPCKISLCNTEDLKHVAYAPTVTILSSIAIALSFTTLLFNGFFIFIIFLYQELRTCSNYLFLNLAIVNITYGTASLVSCFYYYRWLIDCARSVCFYMDVFSYFVGTGMALTMTTFTVISVERYICIFYALRWAQIITKRRVVIILILMWLTWLGTSGLLRLMNQWSMFKMVYIFQALINIGIIFVTNAKIFKEIRRHENSIAAQVQQSGPNTDEITKAREKKRARTMILMVSLLLLCYIPTLILQIGDKTPLINRFKWKFVFLPFRVILLSHTTFDVFVYGLRTEETRKAFKKLLNRLNWRASISHNSNSNSSS